MCVSVCVCDRVCAFFGFILEWRRNQGRCQNAFCGPHSFMQIMKLFKLISTNFISFLHSLITLKKSVKIYVDIEVVKTKKLSLQIK